MPSASEDWQSKQLRSDVKLTKAQADDLGMLVDRSYKPEHYRY